MMKKITLLFILLAVSIGYSQNLALSGTASASSEMQPASNAIDENAGTRWESVHGETADITIDLGASYNVGQILLNWEGAFADDYEILISDDSSFATSTTIYTTTTGDGGLDDLAVSGTGRYVRMNGKHRFLNAYGYSLYEFEIYEAADPLTDATLSDLKVNGTTVAGFSISTLNYNVLLPLGTTVVPTVVATTSQGTASAVVTDATSIPGTTTITVKSSDESVTMVYNVEFKEQYKFATLDFEPAGQGVDWTWEVAENGTNAAMEFVANPSVLAPNISATVAKFTAEAAGASWALVITEDVGDFTFDVEHSIIKVMVYKSVISDVGIKFEGDNVREILIPNTKINEWEELTFDFSDEIGKSFNKLVFIPDFASRSQDNIVYWDNFTYEEGVTAPDPSGMDVLDFEPNGHGQAIRWSVFENGAGASNLEFVANPSVDVANPSPTVAKLAVDAASSGWVGAESKAPDVGPISWSDDLKTIKMKVYSTVLTSVGIKMVPSSGGGGAHGPMEAVITKVNTWQEITLDYTSLIGGAFASNMDIMVIHPNMGTAKGAYDIYFDDITFVDETTAAVNDVKTIETIGVYPNPAQNSWNIKSSNQIINSVQVFDVLGKQVLSVKPNLNEVQIDASSLKTGLYFAIIKAISGSKTIKLIKN